MDRETIQTAAFDLFRKISFEKTSVSDITKACGIGKGTFYLYFKSKNEIFSSIIEERIKGETDRFGSYYRDPSIPLEDKIGQYFDNLIENYFIIKDLLFGSFETIQGRMLKDVFFKYEKYYLKSIDNLTEIISANRVAEPIEHLHEKMTELMELILGRMVVFLMINDWNDREGLKGIISPMAVKLYGFLVEN
jgi:AcrR family transcriptional regulator